MLIIFECQLDSLLYQIWNEPYRVPVIIRLGQRIALLEKRLQKCKDVCINNREEIVRELKRQFLHQSYSLSGGGGATDFEDLEFFTTLSQGDQSRIRYSQLEESKEELSTLSEEEIPIKEGGDPLFVGERLRM